MKVAVEGCAHGELERIYETLTHLEQKENVKVDLLLCCGDFQAVRNQDDLNCVAVPQKYREMGTFYKYYSGEKTAPILTIFIGGNHEASNFLQELPFGGWVAPNIYYLGYAGCVTVAGIRIAGLSGIYKGRDFMKGHYEKPPYSEDTKRSVYHIRNVDVFRLKQLKQPIDIMLSHDWPRGVYHFGDVDKLLRAKPFFKEEVLTNSLGSAPSQELLTVLQPTYWFAAHLHVKFPAIVTHTVTEEDVEKQTGITKFLALDKCLPRRHFLQLHNQFAAVGAPLPPPSRPDHTVVHGLKSSIELLSQCSDQQHEKRTSLTENASKVQNRTRVICLTSVREDSQIISYEEYFLSMLLHQNKVAAGSDNLIPIHHCHLVMINVHPNGQLCEVRGHPAREMSSVLTVEAHSVLAGDFLSNKLCSLILSHYNLASTTVTGIPMKEEQNASSSANYDVEIFHPASAHQTIFGGTFDSSMIRSLREGSDYETVTLKWCTPRGSSAVELQHCTMMQRITPVDVNSRPSSCLINFLLSGRSVMLEMPRRTGGKVMSHLLAAHGGEIFIHTLSTTRSVLEDPPSISEGCGGRVTDYRITDFAAVMRLNKLLPLKRPSSESLEDSPMYQMKKRLERYTKYWPMTISSTMIFNLRQYLDPLLTCIAEEEISDEQVMQCQHLIFNLVGLESRHEPLNPPTMGHKGKGPKRDEQYRVLWSELETYIRANCHSENHRKVLSCLLECRNKPDLPKSKSKDDQVELDQALMELDEFGGQDEGHQRASVIRATTDSPMSPPLHSQHAIGPTSSLLDIWVTKVNIERMRKGPDFYGRTVTPDGGIARLYTAMKQDNEEVEK